MTYRRCVSVLRLVLLCASTAIASAHVTRGTRPADIGSDVDAFIAQQLDQPYSFVPGVAAVVIVNGTIVLNKGYGMRSLDPGMVAPSSNSITHDTIFGIGSLSKTVITVALGVLVDQNKVHWTDKVIEWLPHFAMQDAYVTRNLLLSDLLTHRSGLAEGQGDFGWSIMNEANLTSRLRNLHPPASLRERFQYSNEGWIVAGQVLAAVTATTWCEAVQQLVFEPLAMTHTFCSREHVPAHTASEFLSMVHYFDPCGADQATFPVSPFRFDPNAGTRQPGNAAGSIVSSTDDWSKIMLLLASSTDVPALLTPHTLAHIQAGQTTVPTDWLREGGLPWLEHAGSIAGAGFGLDIVGRVFHGQPYIDKSGDTGLHKARFGMLSERKSGVLLLGNLGGHIGGQLTALKWGVMALLAGFDEAAARAQIEASFELTGFLEEVKLDQVCDACGHVAANDMLCQPAELSVSPLPLREFQGRYTHPYYGVASVSATDTELHLSYSDSLPQGRLVWSRTSAVLNASCPDMVGMLSVLSPSWSDAGQGLDQLGGWCSVLQFRMAPEVPVEHISLVEHTTSFPWGIAMPDPFDFFFLTHGPLVLRLLFGDEVVLHKG